VTNPNYPIDVFSSNEDDAWVADVPDLMHCSAVGGTAHEAVAEVEVAVSAWLEAARAQGRSIPQPSSRALRA
jgi:predicted RNase H-like HicB family nuclease